MRACARLPLQYSFLPVFKLLSTLSPKIYLNILEHHNTPYPYRADPICRRRPLGDRSGDGCGERSCDEGQLVAIGSVAPSRRGERVFTHPNEARSPENRANMPDARVTLRRKSPYCTRSNRFKKLRTPGGKLTIQYLKKRGKVPKCGDTGAPLFGMAVRRPKELMRLSKRNKTVSRCYGGALSGKAVRSRYVQVSEPASAESAMPAVDSSRGFRIALGSLELGQVRAPLLDLPLSPGCWRR